jgi:hypothetical protein
MIKKFNELNSEQETPNGNFKVVFEGFQTEQQAKAFAQWYEGSGEQDSGVWLEEYSDASGAYVDMQKFHEKGGFKVNENDEIIVPLRIYNK